MYICSEFLHMPHIEFLKLPREEKLKWYIFVQEKGKYQKKQDAEMKRKAKENEMKNKQPSNPGLK